jgi:hypothetical protein
MAIVWSSLVLNWISEGEYVQAVTPAIGMGLCAWAYEYFRRKSSS